MKNIALITWLLVTINVAHSSFAAEAYAATASATLISEERACLEGWLVGLRCEKYREPTEPDGSAQEKSKEAE